VPLAKIEQGYPPDFYADGRREGEKALLKERPGFGGGGEGTVESSKKKDRPPLRALEREKSNCSEQKET